MKYSVLLLFLIISNSCTAQNTTEAEAARYLEEAIQAYEANDNQKLSGEQIDNLSRAVDFFGKDKEQYLYQWSRCLYLRANQYYVALNEKKALEDIFQVVEALKKEGLTDEHYSLAGECYNLAQIVYSELLFNLDQAKAMLDFSLEQYEKAGDHYGVAESCLNGAFALTRLGRCELAEQYFDRGAAVMAEHEAENFEILPYYSKYVKGMVHLCMAGEHYFNGEASRVEERLLLARDNFHSIVGILPPAAKLAVYYALGSSYISPSEWSNLDSAAHHFNQALELFQPSPHLDEYVYALWVNIPEFFQLAKENPDELLRFTDSTDRTLPISIFDPADEDLLNTPYRKRVSYVSSLTHIGLAFQQAYQNTKDIRFLEAALKIYRSFVKVVFFNRYVLATDASIEAYDNRYSEVFPDAAYLAWLLYEATGEKGYLEEAFRISEQSKSFTLRRHLHHAFSSPQYSEEQRALWEKEEALRLLIHKQEVEYLRTQDTLFLGQASRSRVELWSFIQGLQDGTPAERQYYSERFNTNIPSISGIQQLLQADEALVEFEVSTAQSFAFAITKNDVQVIPLKGLNENGWLIDSFDFHLKHNGVGFYSFSHQLHEEIFEPIKQALPGDIRHLTIVPDHKYWKVNFDALVANPQPRQYLLKDYVVSYSYSAAILHQMVRAREARKQGGHIGFFYGQYPGEHPLPDMENMRREAIALSQSVKGAKAYPGASKPHFVESLNGLKGAVLAVHGELGEQENISGIHLAFPEAPETHLYIQEVYGLPMKGTQFLFLGACNGAWGDFSRGEGISSIARAFHYAGCPSLVAAQMEAPEPASAEIMASFFQYLDQGFSYAESLNKAKSDLRNKSGPFQSPFHWAPFLCIGDGFSRFR